MVHNFILGTTTTSNILGYLRTFIISQLHQRIIHLLHNLTLTKVGSIPLSLLSFNLPLNPKVSLTKSINNFRLGFPSQLFKNENIIGVTSTYTHGSIDMLDGHILLPFIGERHFGKLIHIHHFSRTKIDGYLTIRKCQSEHTLDTVINESEGTSLLPISPHLHLFRGSNSLPAKGSGGLFTSPRPCTPWSINIMESSNANVKGEIASVGQGHFLRVQFLQSIHVLRTSWPRITLNEPRVFWIFLLGLVVDTCRTGVEEITCPATSCRLEHVHTNGGIIETQYGFIGADEAHAPHVSGEIVHLQTVLACFYCHLELAQVVEDEFVAEFFGFHEFIFFPVDYGDLVAIFFEAFGDVGTDETGAASDADFGSVAGREGEGTMF
mmetsp:Transcript_887/g.1367  ORF Transcript_887/g.1367 Transcript_887/m.1367 type:complete len:380 (+) Transcript_887:170-1309(+)